MTTQRLFTHLLAIFVITVWGVTFVSTKLLLEAGFNPASILFYRFALAYIGIWLVAHRLPLFAKSLKDELCFVLMGVFGGSMYFFTENLALRYTLTNNVSLIVCMNPLLIAIIAHFLSKDDKLSPRLLLGSLLALVGVTLVIFNGNFTFEITIVGELLAFAAAFSWAFYTLLMRRFSDKYPALFLTRKVMLYGMLTALPIFLYRPLTTDFTLFTQPVVWGNFVFLGLVATLLCFFLWNKTIKFLGAVRASTYIYGMPITTLIASVLILGEPVSLMAIIGTLMVLIGVYFATRK